MSHLRDVVAALVDGELSDSERERALVHLAGCSTCRAEVAAHRALKDRLAALAVPPPPPGLLAELHRMAEPGEPLPRTRPALDATRPPTVPVDGRPAGRSGVRPATRRTRGRRVRTALSGGAMVVAATLLTAFAVGGEPAPTDSAVRPDVDRYVIEHTRTSRVVPFAEPPADAVGVTYRRSSP